MAGEYYCLLPDLPGHGSHTARPFEPPLTFEIIAAEIAAQLDLLGYPQIDMVGYSMGGRIALYFAARYPERVNKLVIESGSPGITEQDARQARRRADARRAGEIVQRGMPAFVEDWYQLPLWASLEQRPEKLQAKKDDCAQNDPVWMAKVIEELSPGTQPAVWDALPNMHIPTLLAAGALDPKYPQLLQKAVTLLPQGKMLLFEDAGHNIHYEQPESFARQVINFLSSPDQTTD